MNKLVPGGTDWDWKYCNDSETGTALRRPTRTSGAWTLGRSEQAEALIVRSSDVHMLLLHRLTYFLMFLDIFGGPQTRFRAVRRAYGTSSGRTGRIISSV